MSLKSTVCLIVRNEGPYLCEWVAHYSALGFDRVVIYDNESADDSAVTLGRLHRAGLIVHRPWTAMGDESPQVSAYTDAFRRCDTEWMFIADADELLVLHRDDTVGAFLSDFDDRPEVTAIGCNWRLFGDSGHAGYEDRPMAQRFTRAQADDNLHLKSFTRVRALGLEVGLHVCQTSGEIVHPSGRSLSMSQQGRSDQAEYSVAQVNHYYTKTYEEYQDKRRRGRGAVSDGHPSKYAQHHDEAFHAHNLNEVTDESILRHRARFDAIHSGVRRIAAREPGPLVQLGRRARSALTEAPWGRPKSAACLIVKDEGPYLAEWVAHYTALGFDRVIIYENNSTDDSPRILERLENAGLITYRPWPGQAGESPQAAAYRDAFRQLDAQWMFIADADELLVLHRHETVNAFLSEFDERPEVGTIGVNWRMFGDSGLERYEDRPMAERFTGAAAAGNPHLKSFTRVETLGSFVGIHICKTRGQMVHPSGRSLTMTRWGLSDHVEIAVAQVNHYYTKTYEEYQNKRRRGYADRADDHPLKFELYKDANFRSANVNAVVDTSIQKHRPAFDRVHGRIRRLAASDLGPAGYALERTRTALDRRLKR